MLLEMINSFVSNQFDQFNLRIAMRVISFFFSFFGGRRERVGKTVQEMCRTVREKNERKISFSFTEINLSGRKKIS